MLRNKENEDSHDNIKRVMDIILSGNWVQEDFNSGNSWVYLEISFARNDISNYEIHAAFNYMNIKFRRDYWIEGGCIHMKTPDYRQMRQEYKNHVVPEKQFEVKQHDEIIQTAQTQLTPQPQEIKQQDTPAALLYDEKPLKSAADTKLDKALAANSLFANSNKQNAPIQAAPIASVANVVNMIEAQEVKIPEMKSIDEKVGSSEKSKKTSWWHFCACSTSSKPSENQSRSQNKFNR